MAADVAAAQGCDSFSMTICTLAKKTNLYIPFPYSKGLQDKHGLCTFKHKFVHTPCTFKQKFVHTLCTFKHFQKKILPPTTSFFYNRKIFNVEMFNQYITCIID